MLIWVLVHIRSHQVLLQECCLGEPGSAEKMDFQKGFSWSFFHILFELAHTSGVKITV